MSRAIDNLANDLSEMSMSEEGGLTPSTLDFNFSGFDSSPAAPFGSLFSSTPALPFSFDTYRDARFNLRQRLMALAIIAVWGFVVGKMRIITAI